MTSEHLTGYLELVYAEAHIDTHRVDLRSGEVTMGRAAGNTIVWTCLQVSRQHAVMEYIDQSWKLKDLSTNGLLVNGHKMPKNVFVELHDADLISFIPTGVLQYRFYKVHPPTPKLHHTIVLDSSPSEQILVPAQQLQSNSPIRMNEHTEKSPKRKTNSESNDPLDQDRKRKRIFFNASPCNVENEDLIEVEPSPNFYAESPPSSSFSSPSPSSSGQSNAQVVLERKDNDFEILSDDDNEDVTSIKDKLKRYQDRIRDLEFQNNKLKLEKNREVGLLKNKISSAQSEYCVFKEELYKQLMEVLENEFSCCICNEIFIQATVTDCGHTFCGYCISEWSKRKPECPNCRKHVKQQVKHIEMENFVSKLHTMFSEEIRQRREQIIEDRNRQMRQVKEAAAASSRTSSSRGGRNRLGAVEFSFAPDRLVDFLAELQQINDMFVPNRRATHHHLPSFHPPPSNLNTAAPEVGNLSFNSTQFNLRNFHPDPLIASRAAHMVGGGSRRRSSRISMRGGRPPHPPVLGVNNPGGVGRGSNPPNIPEVAHLPDYGIGPMDILTVD